MDPCKICYNENNNRLHTAREMLFGWRHQFDYIECGACGCLQIASVPDNLSDYYSADYYAYREKALSHSRLKKAKHQVNKLLLCLLLKCPTYCAHFPVPSRLSFLRWLTPCRLTRNDSMLEIGCGAGHLLKKMHRFGFKDLTGVDPYLEKDQEHAPGCVFIKQTLNQIKGTFNFVMLHHTFEHLENPLEALQHLYRLVKPGGYVLIRIPLAGSHAHRRYGIHWFAWEAPRHLYLHTLKSMKLLTETIGFKTEKIIFDSSPLQCWASEQYEKDIPFKDFETKRRSLYNKKQLKIWRRQAAVLNQLQEGDQACFYLKKPDENNLT